ncbi:DUF72 domain-containing protein [Bacillus horti]|uniref:Uncharacterized protein YecE (DUF72 family) n=1 Tax=Caldalkalibacillus horti TaxID=77523 RepID=A0ABT9W2I3_9BACI|nr:DUF72 domain-containing protein [Bacillus horti]MDQ0167446.1 uncharacterized protein YecE (DUF72 family) [Bacillus horti]
MIDIGLTGWGDHDSLYTGGSGGKNKLQTYSGYFPVVEVDSSFYAIQSVDNYRKWIGETPPGFRFVIKAYQGMTGHERGEIPFSSKEEMFEVFKASIQPVIKEDRLSAVLFQFPPWFDCKKAHVDVLRWTKEHMSDIPVALEFRHQSWFEAKWRDKTLHFMEQEGWFHSVCDEPQAGSGSVPTVLEATHPDCTLVRFHGRNVHGWNQSGQQNWREVRYLYRYNEQELLEWKEHLLLLAKKSKDVVVLFNNNSGGDAADNARQMIQLLGIEYEGLAPRQLGFFDTL